MKKETAFAEARRINNCGLWKAEPVPNGDGTFAIRLTTRGILGQEQYFGTLETEREASYYRRYN